MKMGKKKPQKKPAAAAKPAPAEEKKEAPAPKEEPKPTATTADDDLDDFMDLAGEFAAKAAEPEKEVKPEH